MTALIAVQGAMRDWLLDGNSAIAKLIAGDHTDARLRIYTDAYRLRLLDVLANDFPTTKAMLGEDAFDALGRDYLRAHPSTQPSVRHFGHAFADWLATRSDVAESVSQLARFEWTQGECFDAADAPLLDMTTLATLPADAWPTLRLHLHPAVRLLTMSCNAPALIGALAADSTLPALHPAPQVCWLLWRSDGDVHWRQLEADEATALQAVQTGESFAELCERMMIFHQGDGPLRAASLLKRWLTDGLLTTPGDPPSD